MSCAKTAEPTEMPFGMWTWIAPRNPVLAGGPDPPDRRGNFCGHLPSDREVYRISDMSQSYSLGGSSVAAIHCQYCSNLFCLCVIVAALLRV